MIRLKVIPLLARPLFEVGRAEIVAPSAIEAVDLVEKLCAVVPPMLLAAAHRGAAARMHVDVIVLDLVEWARWGGQLGEQELTLGPGFRRMEAHGQTPHA